MYFQISKAVLQQAISHCAENLPSESCGVLLGYRRSDKGIVCQFVSLANEAAEPWHTFEVNPAIWTNLLFASNKLGLSIMGMLHSHPDTAAIPSDFDLRTQWYTLPSHWIVSFANINNPIVEAYRYSADGTYQSLHWLLID